MPRRRRLDTELVEQGFFSSADDAMRAVMAGDVSTTDRRLASPGEQVTPGIPLHVRGRAAYVSRGGLKLERGLAAFGVDPCGLACLDVGCSTGGFTDCLLKHGAASVVAVDVGYAQFSWELRGDARVRLLERTNVVDVPELLGEGVVDLAVCDVSFTSVTTVLPAVLALLRPGGTFLTLVKPQFEAGKDKVGKKGVVRDASVHLEVLEHFLEHAAHGGFTVKDITFSPIRGPEGNIEYLGYLSTQPGPTYGGDLKALVEASHELDKGDRA